MDVNGNIDPGCICRGNWRAIVKEATPFLDKSFKSCDEKIFTFLGVMHGSDDYYYLMWDRNLGLRMLSCVGSIEAHGYTLLEGLQEE